MNISRLAAALLTSTILGAGTLALGQTTTTAPATTASRPTGPGLTIPELIERLSGEGYRDFSEIERKSDKLYKLTARNAQGRTLEMQVDARTAEILASEEDEDDD